MEVISCRVFALALAAAITGCATHAREGGPSRYDAELRRTSFGIAHVKAREEGSLGYGIGYAYAEDNLCLLAEQIVTVRGQRSKYFGEEEKFRGHVGNLQADTLYGWLDQEGRTEQAWNAQPRAMQLLFRGYADGVNRYLRDTPQDRRPAACAGAEWVGPITEFDMVRLSRFYAVASGLGGFSENFGKAQPTVGQANGSVSAHDQSDGPIKRASLGSNAVAIGRDLSASGHGMLLGNPHLEWEGPYRFWQLHATIPSRLDVMGASLPGYPGIQIGFNRHIAWSHTVDTSAHYVLYRMKLDDSDPTRYLVDGKSEAMKTVSFTVTALQADGSLKAVERTIYETRLGPILTWPGWLEWGRDAAFVLHDPNKDNHRTAVQWLDMARASSIGQFSKAIASRLGVPWVNTIAADDRGNALYMNVSAIPYVDASTATACALPDRKKSDERVFLLDGSRSACWPQADPGTPQPGLYPAGRLPVMMRTDFVQNSNDSAWLTNAAHPLTGYSPFVSREGVAQDGRTRFALDRIAGYVRDGRRMDLKALQDMVMDNEVYFAGIALDDLKALCGGRTEVMDEDGSAVTVGRACAELGAWDRKVNVDSGQGYVYFRAFMEAAAKVPDAWATPFDARDPVHTPRGLRIGDEAVRMKLLAALARAAKDVESQGFARGANWGDIQVAVHGAEKIPFHGGDYSLGVYNHMGHVPLDGGLLRVTDGATYVQAVSLGRDGPHAEALLAYSQSMNPDSPHSADQTRRFSRKEWIVLPFTDAQIEADPEYSSRRLTQ